MELRGVDAYTQFRSTQYYDGTKNQLAFQFQDAKAEVQQLAQKQLHGSDTDPRVETMVAELTGIGRSLNLYT